MKYRSFLVLGAVIFLLVPIMALAASSSSSSSAASATTDKCKLAQTNIRTKLSLVSSLRSKQYRAITDRRTRLTRFVTQLKNSGYKTDKLDQDIKTLSTTITEYNKAYTDYNKTVNDLRSKVCTLTPDEKKTQKDLAKTQLQVVKDKVVAIKDFLNNVIKKDLSDIKNQK
jgi:chromosome segregation ATPase